MTMRPNGCSSVRWFAAMVGVFALLGCGDLAHVNPYDPAAPFEITVAGPNPVHLGDTVTFTVTTKPRWTRPAPPEWSSLDSRVLYPLGEGRYVANQTGTATIQVRFGPRLAARAIVVQGPALATAVDKP